MSFNTGEWVNITQKSLPTGDGNQYHGVVFSRPAWSIKLVLPHTYVEGHRQKIMYLESQRLATATVELSLKMDAKYTR